MATWGPVGPLQAHVLHMVGANRTGEQSQVRLARAAARMPMPPNLDVGPERIAIEGQQIDKRKARPADLFTLAHTTGAAIVLCDRLFPEATIIVPTPKEWKNGVSKHAHQGRMYQQLGWGYIIIGTGTNRYARPVRPPARFQHISPGQWKHVGDALLLARWAQNH